MNDPSAISGVLGLLAVFGSAVVITWLLFGEEWDD
jgi:hypothetical protein